MKKQRCAWVRFNLKDKELYRLNKNFKIGDFVDVPRDDGPCPKIESGDIEKIVFLNENEVKNKNIKDIIKKTEFRDSKYFEKIDKMKALTNLNYVELWAKEERDGYQYYKSDFGVVTHFDDDGQIHFEIDEEDCFVVTSDVLAYYKINLVLSLLTQFKKGETTKEEIFKTIDQVDKI